MRIRIILVTQRFYRNFLRKKDDPDPVVADSDPVVADSDPLVASSVQAFCARNSQREGRSLQRQGRDHPFQWDVGISVGFFTETIGSLRNPETRRTPPYEQSRRVCKGLSPSSSWQLRTF